MTNKERHSFRAAARGILRCVEEERHMRFHTAAIPVVLLFSLFFSLSAVEYALLFVTFALVLAAELFNSALERLVDAQIPFFSKNAAAVKDFAAGAVLVCAFFSVLVGAALFWKPEELAGIPAFFAAHPAAAAGLVLLLAVLALYVLLAPSGMLRLCRKIFRRSKSSGRPTE